MRRTPDSTIKEAILFPVEEIRTTAAAYFARSYTQDESLMPLVIQAVEQYGRDKAFNLLRDAEGLPQTEPTVRWVCNELEKDWHLEDVAIDNYCFALGLLLCAAPVELLKRGMATLRCFPTELTDRFQHRIQRQSWDWDSLWNELELLGQEPRKRGRFNLEQSRRGQLIVEALARHRDKADLVVRLLDRRYREDERKWAEPIEPLLAELAGRMRLGRAVAVLVERLHEDDLPLNESCIAALTRIGGDRVVEAIADQWEEGGEDFRRCAAEVLEQVHTDLSAEKCLEFLVAEEDESIREFLASALLGNFVNEAVDPIREMLKQQRHEEFDDLKFRLVAASTIMGISFPEYDLWYEEAQENNWGWDPEVEQERVREVFDEDDEDLDYFTEEDYLDDDDEDFDDEDDEDFDDDEDEDFDDEEDEDFDDEDHENELDETEEPAEAGLSWERLRPFQKEDAPVGRNDPCPCGSGKKYKKCCLKRRQSTSVGSETRMFPIGTVALYGPDDKTTTKIAAGVILHQGAEPIMKRWVATNVLQNPRVSEEMDRFFKQYGVRSVGMSEGNIGCPHEEGEDFPEGEDCPFCPWWKGKQGSGATE